MTRTGLVVSLLGLGALSGNAFADNNLISNSQRYAERNPSAATGRSGTATLAVRSLLGKDGATTVNVTSGRADGSTAGNISKLQFKAFDNQEEVAWTVNHTGLTGHTHQLSLAGLVRGQPLQTHANIKGIDGKRTDVVVTSGNIKLRPDLAINGIQAPSSQKSGLPVVISAVVSEINGDTGATANCVLTVDGVEADRATGIWVDSNGSVTCAFTKVFDTVGTYALGVSATDVDPGDWDTANNRATASIEIVNPINAAPFNWNASATNYTYHNSGTQRGWYDDAYYNGGYHQDWDYSWTQDGRYEYAALNGWSPTAVTFPITLQVAGTADGLTFVDSHLESLTPTYSYEDSYYRYAYYHQYDQSSGLYHYVYTEQYGSDYTQSQINVQRFAGDVTYFSQGYTRTWYAYDGSYHYYSHNFSSHDVSGQFWPMTQTMTMNVSMTDAASNNWSAAASVALTPFQYQYDTPYSCYSWGGYYEGYQCYENHTRQEGYSGWTSGQTP